jgi:hypothetical protein
VGRRKIIPLSFVMGVGLSRAVIFAGLREKKSDV